MSHPAVVHPEPSAPPARGMAAWESRMAGQGRGVPRDRRAPRPDDVQLTSSDYLALSKHPEVVAARSRALREHGAGPAPSDMFVLDDPARDDPVGGAERIDVDSQGLFELEMAEFLEAPAAVACLSGWDANVGLLNTLLEPETAGCPVYPDMLAHASLWAGTRGTAARLHPFAHNDVEHLRRLLAEHGPGVVCVDTLYSPTGDTAPLADIVEACEDFGATLVADESHALGVLGPRGNGLAVQARLADRIAFRTADLAKAFAGHAGLIACSRGFADYLPFHAANAISGSTPPPHDIAGLHAALRVIVTDDARRERLSEVTFKLHEGLRAVGCDTVPYGLGPDESPILPLHAGSDLNLFEMQARLDEQGILGAAFLPPTTPRNRALLRLTAHCELTDQQIERVIAACATIAPLIRPRTAGSV